MQVNISADSFDKVDAAVSIIELLITSVTVSFFILRNVTYGWLSYVVTHLFFSHYSKFFLLF